MRRRDLESVLRRRTSSDPYLRQARQTAREAGVPAWIVGGLVRDAALGLRSRDLDLVAGKGAGRLAVLLGQVWGTRGYRFHKRGVTTWRYVAGGNEIDLVDAGRRGLAADLRRREFTVNAVAFDLESGRIVDPLEGLKDLRRGLLRMPRAGVFREDPVRSLRCARFLAQLPDFRLEPGSAREARSVVARLGRAAKERIRDEIDKLLLAASPDRGLQAAMDLGVVDVVLPELWPMAACLAGRDRPNVWEHTLATLAACSSYRRRPAAWCLKDPEANQVVRWALLLHDIAKPDTLRIEDGGRPTFHGHEVAGARRADAVLSRLLLPKRLRNRVCRLIRRHLRPYQLADTGNPTRGMRRLVREAGDDLPLLVVHAACDGLGSGAPDARKRWRMLRATCNELLAIWEARRVEQPKPLLSGADVMRVLGIDPGPGVGSVLDEIATMRDEGRLSTRGDALDYLRGRRPRC